jgi:hypothetical protein
MEHGTWKLAAASIAMAAFVATGCSGLGPSVMARDRFDYVSAVSESWKRQMLLNLLKVRYSDAPVFMDVSSVINSYEMTGEVDLSGQVSKIGRGDEFLGLGASGQFSDRPTITYQPLSGDKFTRSLMLPIPVPAILYLIQSGFPADLVLRVCVNSINELRNSYGGASHPQGGDPKFHDLLTTIREAQNAGGMGMQMKAVGTRQTAVMFLRPSSDPAIAAPVRRFQQLLGLEGKLRELQIVYGTWPDDGEVAMLSRSILQVLIDLASSIEVPPSDVAEGRVYGHQRTPEQERMFPRLLAVHSGAAAPGDAYVAVRYRDDWFWIDDTDRNTKQIFNFLMVLFSLTETGAEQATPIVTIPAR